MARTITETRLSTTAATASVSALVLAAVAEGDLACYFDGLGISKWRNPPELDFGQAMRVPMPTLETSGAIRGAATVWTYGAVAGDNTFSGAALTNGDIVLAMSGAAANLAYTRLTAEGSVVVGNTQVAVELSAKCAVAALSDGGYVIAHSRGAAVPAFSRYNSLGVAVQNTEATGFASATVNRIAAVGLPGGGFIIALLDETNNPKFCRYNAAGVIQGAVTTVEAVAASNTSIGLASLTGGGFVVGYATAAAARFGRYNAAGALQGALVSVAAEAGAQVDVCGLASGGFAYSYQATPGVGNLLKYAVYDSAGVAILAATALAGSPTTDRTSLTGLIDGGFALTSGAQPPKLYRFSPTGVPLSGAQSLTEIDGGTYYAGIAPTPDGGILALHTDATEKPQFATHAATAASVVGAVTTGAIAGGSAIVETVGIQPLTGPFALGGGFTHNTGAAPGNKGAIFGNSVFMKGLV